MSEAPMTKVVRIKSSMRVEDYFERTKAKRDFLAREKQCAEDVAEVLSFEVGFSRHAGGLPPMAVLLAAWRRARDSWKALPLDSPLVRRCRSNLLLVRRPWTILLAKPRRSWKERPTGMVELSGLTDAELAGPATPA
jgi:hypothetical protein